MEQIDNQEQKSKRELLNERLAGKYPDKDFADDETFMGQVYDDYENYDNELGEYKNRENALNDMFAADPRSASFMTDWRNGEDPAVGLMRRFGPELRDALDDPELQDKLAEASKEYTERLTKGKELDDAYNKNWPETVERFKAAADSGKIDEEQIDDVFEFIKKIIDDGIVGIISDETIDLAVKALNHDSDVEDADRAGEVRGRNAKIKEQLRKGSQGDGTAQLDGKNGSVRAARRPELGPLGNVGVSNNIWDRGGEKRIKR